MPEPRSQHLVQPPVGSPTAFIEITIGGKTADFCSGAAIVAPPAMLARDAMIAFWITRLPDVRAVIHRLSVRTRARSASP